MLYLCLQDLAPYLPNVIPGLKQSLLDPVPEVRSVSAKALGAMVKGMGENGFDDLLPWLMQTLTSEQSSVDRSGAAQGLCIWSFYKTADIKFLESKRLCHNTSSVLLIEPFLF